MACVVVLSLMRTLELEFFQSQPRPILQEKELIPCNKNLAKSLHKKLGFLMELLDENRMDGVEAIKDLETKLRNVASQIEDEIELQVVHLYGEEEEGEEDEEEEEEEGDEEGEEEEEEEEKEEEGEEEEDEEEEFSFLPLEMPQGDTGHCQRLHQILHPLTGKSHPCLNFRRILQRAKQDIDAIQEELVKVKMEYNNFIALQGRKTTLDATSRCDELVKMDSSSKHASHSDDIMVGKNNEFKIIRKMLIEHSSKQREVVSIQGMGGIGKTTLARKVYEDPSISFHFDKRAWVVASQHHNKRKMLIDLLNLKGNAEDFTDGELTETLYRSLKCQRYLVVMDDVWSREAWDTVKTCFPDDRNGSRVLLTTRVAEVAYHTSSNNEFFHQVQLLDRSESWSLFHEKACKSRSAEIENIGSPIVDKCKGLPLAILVVAGLFSKLETLNEWKNTAEALNSSPTTTIDEECSRILSSSYNHLPYNLKACFLYLGIFPEDKEIYVSNLVRLWAAEGLVKAFENTSFDVVAKRHIRELKDRNLILVSWPSCCGRKIKAFRMHDLLHSFCVREAQKENLLHVVYENGSSSPSKGFRWVSIQSKNFNTQALFSSSNNCRSILYFSPFTTDLNFKFCNLVRVLYMGIIWKIENLVHLRYLFSYFSSLKKPFRAWNLQTLSIESVDEMNFLEFPQLQHFSCFNTPSDFALCLHQKLKSISLLKPYQCTKEFFTNIPYLNKVIVGCRGGGWDEYCIKNLAYLEQLQNLHLFCSYPSTSLCMDPHNNHIVLLKNLKKLTFHCMPVEYKTINILSKLPKLEVLKLLGCRTIDGEEWKLSEEEIFGQLIYLGISNSNLKRWEANAYHFPKLEHLFLSECYELEEIPADFAEIPNLKSFKLEHCLPSAVASAKRIQEEQRDYGNDDMVVIEEETVQPPKGSNKDEPDEDEE